METNKKHLWGALVGLVRATEGNEHLVNETTHAVTRAALGCSLSDEAALLACLAAVMEEKRRLAPDCFVCLNNCGRTADYDFDTLAAAPDEVREMKETLMQRLQTLAQTADIERIYDALFALGMDWNAELLAGYLERLQ